MTNPKPNRNQLCAICGHEYFDPGNWRYLDPDAKVKQLVHKTCYKNLMEMTIPLQNQLLMYSQEVRNLQRKLETCLPAYTKFVDNQPHVYDRYLAKFKNGTIDLAWYFPDRHQWSDQFGNVPWDVVAWMPIPR